MDFLISRNPNVKLILEQIVTRNEQSMKSFVTMSDFLKTISNSDKRKEIEKRLILICIHINIVKYLNKANLTINDIHPNRPLAEIFDFINLGLTMNRIKSETSYKMPSTTLTKESFLKMIFIVLISALILSSVFYHNESAFIVFFTFFSPLVFIAFGAVNWFLLKKKFPKIFSIEKFSSIYSYKEFLYEVYDLNSLFYTQEKLTRELYEMIDIDYLDIQNELDKIALLFPNGLSVSLRPN